MTLLSRFFLLLSLGVLLSTSAGCASFGKKLKAFLGGKPQPEEQESTGEKHVTYSDNPNHMNGPLRQYRRITKKDLEQEAMLGERAGSLWTMEGQGAYLFSQNIIRMVGDPIGIKIEGDAKEQLDTKVDIIKRLLTQLEQRQMAKMRQPASEEGAAEAPKEGQAAGAQAKTEDPANKSLAASSEFNVKSVPTRIVERLVDGNYRVKGSQDFMIGSREYKVIVTGIVRAEDFNEEGLSAGKLLDPKFDIVSVRRNEAEI